MSEIKRVHKTQDYNTPIFLSRKRPTKTEKVGHQEKTQFERRGGEHKTDKRKDKTIIPDIVNL